MSEHGQRPLPLEPEAPIEPMVQAPAGVAQPILRATGSIAQFVEKGLELQREATKLNIHNVFSDNGYMDLVVLSLFGLTKLNREGDDAKDSTGRRYEIKTVARINWRGETKKQLGITTEHTLTLANVARYRSVLLWIVAVFNQARPEAIYEIAPAKLEPYFSKWERTLNAQAGVPGAHINNPKIPLDFVMKNGARVYPA
ncbi:MAG: PDDEXK family nuclease [Solirubrobacteraceae bacterium]